MKKTPPQNLPATPGIYLFKDQAGAIIYIGKAKSIRNRVKSYFNHHQDDWKIASLLEDYISIDYIITKTEPEALLLEAQLISEHKPKYNTLLKEGQPFVYIMCTKEVLPTLKLVRNKREKGTYFGPFLQKQHARAAYTYLIKTFRLQTCSSKIDNGCLDYHLGLCAGTCKKEFDAHDYLFRLELALDVLRKNHTDYLQKVKEKIAHYNQEHAFEKARHIHAYLENLETIFTTLQARFSSTKFDTAIIHATAPKNYVATFGPDIAQQLQEFLGHDTPISTIDCFDISHFQSTALVGSCIRFKDGKPDKTNFRRFKIKSLTQQNDYAALQEIVRRRYKDPANIPDLIVIDGGKGQLSAVQTVLPNALCISLAKREETIFSKLFPDGKRLDIVTDVGRLLIALRDYTHHFAINYHRLTRRKNLETTYGRKA
jgi:excinuclease ABC subunit C